MADVLAGLVGAVFREAHATAVRMKIEDAFFVSLRAHLGDHFVRAEDEVRRKHEGDTR